MTETRATLNNPILRDGTKVPIFPIGPRVLIERTGEEEVKTQSGLLLPQMGAEETNYGIVLAAGPAAMDVLHDAGIEIGDRIAFGRFAGERLRWRVDGDKNPFREAYMIDCKDVWGCAELADRIFSGDMGLGNIAEDGSDTQYRFYRKVEKKTVEPTGNPGEFEGAQEEQEPDNTDALISLHRRELERLQRGASAAHQRQDIESYEHLLSEMLPHKQAIKNLGGSI